MALQFFRRQNIPVGFVKPLSYLCPAVMEGWAVRVSGDSRRGGTALDETRETGIVWFC